MITITVNGEVIDFDRFPNNETLVHTEVLNKYDSTTEKVKIKSYFGKIRTFYNLYLKMVSC